MSDREESLLDHRLGYRPELDGLRAIAVLLVIGVHYAGDARWLISGGGIGVNVFFVLSGFLITRLLMEERADNGRVSVRAFYRRRAARLLPALALLLGFVLIAEAVFALYGETDAVYRGIATSGLYVYNWDVYSGNTDPALGFMWSLAIEEQFYLIWPALFILAARLWGLAGARRVGIGLLVVGTTSALFRSAVFHQTAVQISHATDANGLIGLMAGCVVALSFHIRHNGANDARPLLRATAVVAMLFLAVIFVVGGSSTFYHYGGWLAIAGATSVALIALLRGDLKIPFLTHRRVIWIGAASYGLYLWHLPLLVTAGRLVEGRSYSDIEERVLGLALTFAAAGASLRWIERPIRRRFGRARAASTPQSSATHRQILTSGTMGPPSPNALSDDS